MDISVENNVLQVESLSHVPFNDLLSLYRQGYRLAQDSNIGIELGLSVSNVRGNNIIRNNNIRGLASCPSTVTTGTTLTLSAAASSGTVPYTYHWSVKKPDGSTETLTNQASNSYVAGTDGDYTVSVYVTDSCAQGAKTSPTDSCVITASTVVTPTKYNCVAGACQGPFATGTYNSLAECQTACTGGGVTKYSCYQNQCVGPYTVGEFNSLAECQASGCGGGGGGGAGCVNCDLTNNYCLAGNCIPKKYALFGGIGLVALLVLTR